MGEHEQHPGDCSPVKQELDDGRVTRDAYKEVHLRITKAISVRCPQPRICIMLDS